MKYLSKYLNCFLSSLSPSGFNKLSVLENKVGNLFPRLLFKFRLFTGYGVENEISLLHKLCVPTLNSIDVGANAGMYTYHMLKFSKFVYSFEPNPIYFKRLKSVFGNNASICSGALSNVKGTAMIRVPNGICGMGTIENENNFGGQYSESEIATFNVDTYRLDDLDIYDIGFIKIDVEGHEMSVLEGASQTIDKYKPAFLIEIEERHKTGALKLVREFLNKFGYNCYFLQEGRVHRISNFIYEEHQKTLDNRIADPNMYIYNFIFLTDEHVKSRLADIMAVSA